MNVRIRDSAALRKLSPTLLRAYLQSRGWTHVKTLPRGAEVWSITHNGTTHGTWVLPYYKDPSTDAVRISETVQELEAVEERHQLDIYYDILSADADIIRISPKGGVGKTGWSLDDSADFLVLARDLVLAAALAAEFPVRPVHRGGPGREVEDYARSVKPRPGYESGPELILHSQVPAVLGASEGSKDFADAWAPPFPRRATMALNAGLREAGQKADAVLSGGSVADVFQNRPGYQVSANFCEAVAALARRGRGVGISVSWAATHPAATPGGDFEFPESAADALGQAAEWLRRNSPGYGARVSGELVGPDWQDREQFDGQAALVCQVDGRAAALHVRFDVADHDAVWRAFRDGVPVSVRGDIYREGRRYVLRNPTNVTVESGAA